MTQRTCHHQSGPFSVAPPSPSAIEQGGFDSRRQAHPHVLRRCAASTRPSLARSSIAVHLHAAEARSCRGARGTRPSALALPHCATDPAKPPPHLRKEFASSIGRTQCTLDAPETAATRSRLLQRAEIHPRCCAVPGGHPAPGPRAGPLAADVTPRPMTERPGAVRGSCAGTGPCAAGRALWQNDPCAFSPPSAAVVAALSWRIPVRAHRALDTWLRSRSAASVPSRAVLRAAAASVQLTKPPPPWRRGGEACSCGPR